MKVVPDADETRTGASARRKEQVTNLEISEDTSKSHQFTRHVVSDIGEGLETPHSAIDAPLTSNIEPNIDVGSTSTDNSSAPLTPVDTDDEYDLSDRGDSIDESQAFGRPSLNGITSLSEHLTYLSQALTSALDSIELDQSLAIQAKTSGLLHSESHRLLEKTRELVECMSRLDKLYKENFVPHKDSTSKNTLRKVDVLNRRYAKAEKRLQNLLRGKKTSNMNRIFGGKHVAAGVPARHPIEYNQARDKVLERIHGDLEG